MFAMLPEPQHHRIRNEREYREWQLALRGIRLAKRPIGAGLLTRLTRTIRRLTARRDKPVVEPRFIEQEASRLHG
jgi:hypothetical protein